MNDIQRILVLGSTGFIGSHLIRGLNEKCSDSEVIGYSSSDVDLLDTADIKKLSNDFDLNTIVIMCAMVKKEFGDNLDSYAKNLKMATNVSEVLRENPVRKFIYISSTAVYGEEIHNLNIRETTLPVPTSYYGLAKCASEQLFQKIINDQEDTSLVLLRPPTIYGPEDLLHSYGPAGFIHKAINNEKIILWGDGSELREFVYVYDLVEVIISSVEKNIKGVVNVISGQSYTFKKILDVILQQLESSLKIENRERSKKKVDNVFENGLIKSLFPDFKFTTLKEGVQQTIEKELSLLR